MKAPGAILLPPVKRLLRNRKTLRLGIKRPGIEQVSTRHWPRKGRIMHKRVWVAVTLAAMVALSGCAPLLIGGAGAIVADEAIEQEQGGDGLF